MDVFGSHGGSHDDELTPLTVDNRDVKMFHFYCSENTSFSKNMS